MNKDFHDFERDGWSDAAVVKGYEAGFGRLTIKVIPTMLAAAEVRSGVRLLDIATGPGYVAAAGAERGASVIGVDFAEEMILEARQSYPALDFRNADALALPFGEAEFDAVTMNFGLVHIADPQLAIREALRVLRPGGRFATTVWAPASRAVGFSIALTAVEKYGDRNVALPSGPPFFALGDHAVFRAALEGAGFINVDAQDFEQSLELDSGDDLIAAFEDGTVRTGAILRSQPPERREAVHAAMRAACEAYRQPNGPIVLPMPCVLAVGRKP